jgi:hypothetical protein
MKKVKKEKPIATAIEISFLEKIHNERDEKQMIPCNNSEVNIKGFSL